MQKKDMEGIIEALLFTMGEAVELERIAAVLEEEKETVRQVIAGMQERMQESDRGVQIIELDGAYQMCTKAAHYEHLIKLVHIPKKLALTDVLLETLSIIAYKQPVTRQEIEAIRGVKSDHAVNKLVEYDLVCEVGRLDAPGRPILFGTTEQFLRSFGVSSLDELPSVKPEQAADFRREAEEEAGIVPEEEGGEAQEQKEEETIIAIEP